MLLLLIPMTVSAFGKDWWVTLSLNGGFPLTGMATNDAVYFPDLTGKKTPFLDLGLSLSGGYTPWQLSPTTSFGFMGKFSVLGSISLTVPRDTLGYYLGRWFAISPMACFRFQVGRDSFLNLGAGASYWKYIRMDIIGYPLEHLGSYDLDTLDGSSGIFPAFYGSINWRWFVVELGFTGPDFFWGFGITF